jgi:lipoprotein-anchoring transpeptidase ErfK/SrfK
MITGYLIMNTLFGSVVGIWLALLAPTPGHGHAEAMHLLPGSDEPAVAAAHAEESESELPFRIVVSISERKLYVRDGDKTLGTYPIAVGKSKHPTPKGSFAIRRVIWNPRWVPPNEEWAKGKTAKGPGDPENPMGKVKMFFKEPDYYIHGTNEPGTIGSAASHGCVRMRNDDIIELSKLIMEHGGAPVEPGMVQRLINRVRQTREVRLTNPVPLRIQT